MKLNILKIRQRLGWTQEDLSEHSGLSRSYIAAIENKNIAKSPSMEASSKLAKALGVRIGELFDDARPIGIAGKVGAGAKVPLVDAYEKGDGLYHVACPFELSSAKDIVGVEIEGDSMSPIYKNGDILFYARHTMGVQTEALGAVCICEDENGDVWFKHLKPSQSITDTFDLISLNPYVANIPNARLKWAAPIKLHWPKHLVERV